MSKCQIQIINASDEDAAFVRNLMADVSARFDVPDNTYTSQAKGTICSYGKKERLGFGLGARRLDNVIVVDFNQPQPSAEFEMVYQSIAAGLRGRFGGRLREPELADFIPVDRSVPLSEAARQRVRESLREEVKSRSEVDPS